MPVVCHESLVFSSGLGWIGVVANGQQVVRLVFGYRSRTAIERKVHEFAENQDVHGDMESASPWLRQLATRLKEFADGDRIEFRDIEIDTSRLAPFQRRVVKICRRIPYGQTMSYGQLAAQAGSPAAARAVGNVMARNRVPLIVPCHRVVAVGGRIGGFSAIGGVNTKQCLLEMESRPSAC